MHYYDELILYRLYNKMFFSVRENHLIYFVYTICMLTTNSVPNVQLFEQCVNIDNIDIFVNFIYVSRYL